MSRILRRPMFRGGPVDSRGTGITSGLSYQKGGRVGYFQDQPGGVVLGKDLIANNIFSGTPQSKDYMDKKDFYKNYKIRSAEDIAEDYEDMMRQKEDDLTMTFGIDDYSGFQNKVAEDLDHYRDPQGGMMKYFQEAKAKDDAARKEAANYDVTIDEVINNQTEELPQELTPAQLENIELRKLLEERMKKGTPEEEIEKNRKIFEKAYGSGRADDASAMLLNFAGKALKPEATVKGAFGEFFEEEGKRPSERKKYKDAATTAAINAYLTGEKTLAEVEAFKAKTKWATADKYDQAFAIEEGKTIGQHKATLSSAGKSDSQLTKAAAENYIASQKKDKGKILNTFSSKKDPLEKLLVEVNVDEYFMDSDTKQVFKIIKIGDEITFDRLY